MLVNGQPAKQDTASLLIQLASLNSSFPDYIGTKVSPPLPNDVVGFYNYGMELQRKGEHAKALEQFAIAEKKLPSNQPNNIFLSDINNVIAYSHQTLGNYQEAEARFKNSIAFASDAKENFRVEGGYKNLANLHKIKGTLSEYETETKNALEKSQQIKDHQGELQARLALGGISRIKGDHQEAVVQYSKSYDLQQGKIDYDAHRVEQHEVGFSNKEKIGTDNIQQCVAVILYDPVTKKTALAHVDKFTDATSLSEVISQFPPGTKLNAHLVGGRDRSPQSKEVSDENIRKVTAELHKHSSVDIKSADIGDKGAPSGIIFDPQTGKLEHGVPGKHHETTPERKLLLNISPNSKLNFAFDFTKSKDIKAVELTNQQKEQVVLEHLSSRVTGNETWTANIISEPRAIVTEKIRKTNPSIVESAIEKHIDQKINESLQGRTFDGEKRKELKDNLLKASKESLQQADKPIMIIGQEIENNIRENVSKIATSPAPVTNSQEKSPIIISSRNTNFFNAIGNAIDKAVKVVNKYIDKAVKGLKNLFNPPLKEKTEKPSPLKPQEVKHTKSTKLEIPKDIEKVVQKFQIAHKTDKVTPNPNIAIGKHRQGKSNER